jgi:uncharacterized protein (TIGR02594 family)
MKKYVTPFDVAEVFIGEREVGGGLDNPLIMAMLRTDNQWPEHDEVPWCSAFVNFVCKLLRLPRSKSLLARSWLGVGRPVQLLEACVGFDIVVLKRGADPQPGPEDHSAPGHVGFYAGHASHTRHHVRGYVDVLGGNQGDTVKISRYKTSDILSIRRLA